MNWKRASEITEPGAYWVDDRRPTGTPSASRDWYVVQVRASDRLYVVNASIAREGWFLERWAKNIFLYGPIEPPEMGLASLWGQWPGDESIEDLLQALKS